MLGVVASALVISACAPARAQPPPDPTAAEVTSMMNSYVAQQTEQLGFGFPKVWGAVSFERFVRDSDRPIVLDSCVRDLGVTGVRFSADATTTSADATPDEALLQRLAIQACALRYPALALRSYLMTNAQLNYMFDYYQNVLVPCLRSSGYLVSLPGREQFVNNGSREFYVWNPYDDGSLFAIGQRSPGIDLEEAPSTADGQLLIAKCPPRPSD